MGSFAGYFGEARVPEGKRAELKERMLALLTQGGMMDYSTVSMFGYKLSLLKPPTYDGDENVVVGYNYFEDDRWEDAGYNAKRGDFWSNKIGGSKFATVVCAAYVLLEFYSETRMITAYNGEILSERGYIGWLNYLFHEAYTNKRVDNLCELYEMLPEYVRKTDLICLLNDDSAFAEPYDLSGLTPVPAISTEKFLNISDENRLLFWRPDGDVRISEETTAWFAELRTEFDEIMGRSGPLIEPKQFLPELMRTLRQACDDYQHIYFFEDQFHEFAENGNSRRIQAAVILLRNMMERYKDEVEELKKAHWPYELRKPGRLAIKRYVALLANLELRQQVFGF